MKEKILKGEKLTFQGNQYFINERTNMKGNKTKYFLWSLSQNCYVSSLFPTSTEGVFSFDIRDSNQNYTLNINKAPFKITAVVK